jgi:hypothetical protein
LKKKALMFFALVTITIVAGSSAVYVYFFLPQTLSSAETARRMNSIYSRTVGILDFMSDDMKELVDRNITATIFSTRMDDLKGDMLAVRADLTELKKVALPTYVESINLLDRGLQAYSDAIDYAHDLNFNQTSIYLGQGTEYVNRSKVALPTS